MCCKKWDDDRPAIDPRITARYSVRARSRAIAAAIWEESQSRKKCAQSAVTVAARSDVVVVRYVASKRLGRTQSLASDDDQAVQNRHRSFDRAPVLITGRQRRRAVRIVKIVVRAAGIRRRLRRAMRGRAVVGDLVVRIVMMMVAAIVMDVLRRAGSRHWRLAMRMQAIAYRVVVDHRATR